MSDMIATLRAIIRDELAAMRAPDIGIVTEVFSRDSDSSENNHQVHIRLRGSGLELQRVPVAAPRLGFSVLPRVGDLMVVIFAGGDMNAPVAIGSLYDADHQPPVGKPEEAVYQPPDDSDSAIRRLSLETPRGATVTIPIKSVGLGNVKVNCRARKIMNLPWTADGWRIEHARRGP